MQDQSAMDNKYFIDEYVYNCPFCKRNNVSYLVLRPEKFNWTANKFCYIYLVECSSCKNISMHLSFTQIKHLAVSQYSNYGRFDIKAGTDIDSLFFYSVPTSFFVLDERIPKVLRDLFAEAEGCLKSNFLTGASVCARKIVYEMADIENAEGNDYESRIKSLKKTRTNIDPVYFDTLVTIQEVTSDKVHEQSYDGWNSNHLQLILATLITILGEMYVAPKIKQEKRESIIKLKSELISGNKPVEGS